MRKILHLILLCAALSACDSSVDVDATANVPAQYSSVLVTVKEVWFNESTTAVPEDTTWQKFPLSEPVTLDLTQDLSGTLTDVASQLKVSAGEYHQVRLYLADRTEPLASSASNASATFNNQVTFLDANGTQTTLPLEVANAAQGIGIQTDLKVSVPTEALLAATVTSGGSTLPGGSGASSSIARNSLASGTTVTLGTSGTSGTSGTLGTSRTSFTSDTSGTPLADTSSISDTTGTSPDTGTTTPANGAVLFDNNESGSETTVTATSQLVFDAARDLTPFQFSDQPGFLLNPTIAAYDSDRVGTIQGQLDLSALTLADGSSRPDIQVTAEKLSSDSTRRELVASASVSATGAFVLYPLPLDASKADSTTYDLVIHGPGIRTVIIRSVPVTRGVPGNATDIAIGTLTMTPAEPYAVNVASDHVVGVRGARIGFYQTLPDDDAPFLIELRTVDPLTGRFVQDEALSAASTVAFATYSPALSFQEAAPKEGASKYSLSAQAPVYGNGAFSDVLVAPPATAGTVSTFTAPSVGDASPGTIAATMTVGTPGKYDKGALFVTHDGAVVTAVSLDDAFAEGQPSADVSVGDIPASGSSGYYYVEVWAWNSADPAGTFSRQAGAGAVDLRNASMGSAAVAVK